MYFYVPDVKFNSQCKILEVNFIAHALGYHKDFNIEKYFTNSSKISQRFQTFQMILKDLKYFKNLKHLRIFYKDFKTFHKNFINRKYFKNFRILEDFMTN